MFSTKIIGLKDYHDYIEIRYANERRENRDILKNYSKFCKFLLQGEENKNITEQSVTYSVHV